MVSQDLIFGNDVRTYFWVKVVYAFQRRQLFWGVAHREKRARSEFEFLGLGVRAGPLGVGLNIVKYEYPQVFPDLNLAIGSLMGFVDYVEDPLHGWR